jgi:hypothetical protein
MTLMLASAFITLVGDYVKDAAGRLVQAEETPGDWDTGFPRAGTSVMGPLRWQNYNTVGSRCWCVW